MKTNPELWARLEALDFDGGEVVFGFADRLARDNGWTRKFADRAITEYKKFAYLAMSSGHEVTPSDEVDQVWHLHLTYTRHYWGAFAECLGGPLHHGPTTGSSADKTRFDDNYTRTRQSYEEEFGEAPPVDLWPIADIRFGEAPFYTRINTKRNLVLPVPRWVTRAIGSSLAKPVAAVSSLALAGVTLAQAHGPLRDEDGNLSLTNWASHVFSEHTVLALVLGLVIAVFGTIMFMPGKAAKSKGSGGAGCGGTTGGSTGGKGADSGGDGGGSGCGGCGGCGG